MLRVQARSVSKIEYKACIDGDKSFAGTVTWYKDGVERRRFDVLGDHGGSVYDVEYYTVRTHDRVGASDVLCSDNLDKYFRLDDSPDGAAFRAKIAGATCLGGHVPDAHEVLRDYNLLDALSISLDSFDHVDPKTFLVPLVRSKGRQLLRETTTCYTLASGSGGTTEKCYDGEGRMLYSTLVERNHRAVLEAVSVSNSVSDGDFAPPAEVRNIDN